MKIALDVMGGDFAPAELLTGARLFLEQSAAELDLVGREAEIITSLGGVVPPRCRVVDAPDVIGMDEAPATALRRKPRASVAVAAGLVAKGGADAFVSAGSTGAMMAAALFAVGRIGGVERPAVAVSLPTQVEGRSVLVLDVGANVDVKPAHLVQFATMGAIYVERVCGIAAPRVGMLNIGAEPGKGNELCKAAEPLLRARTDLKFVGNVEGDSLWEGHADVVVTDGFAGNVLLKTSEGVSDLVIGRFKQAMQRAGVEPAVAAELFRHLARVRSDAPEYAGAPLLGLDGVAVVCHGKAKGPTIANALRLAEQYVAGGVLDRIRQRLTTGEANGQQQ